jgi:hypothetical protein
MTCAEVDVSGAVRFNRFALTQCAVDRLLLRWEAGAQPVIRAPHRGYAGPGKGAVMKRTVCIGVLVVLALVVPTTASAHTLSLSGAARKAKAAAQAVADTNVTDDPAFTQVSDVFASRRYCARLPLRRGSSRLSPHAVRCFVSWEYSAPNGPHSECIAAVNVKYRSRTSHRTRSRVTDVDCFR